jgi:capsule polysaccharide export protein KpsE/RkpR
VGKVLGRLAVSEAQQRRSFFEQQLKESKSSLVKAEIDLQALQERSGVVVLDKQAEALIVGAAQVRSAIADREIRLRVLRTSATEKNPDLLRLLAELQGLRTELVRMEAREGGTGGSASDLPVGKLPAAAIENIRARRELKLQETLLEAMVRQYESAKLDEAKEGPLLQQVDVARPPDAKSKPARGLIVVTVTFAAMLLTALVTVVRRSMALNLRATAGEAAAWSNMKQAWRLRR